MMTKQVFCRKHLPNADKNVTIKTTHLRQIRNSNTTKRGCIVPTLCKNQGTNVSGRLLLRDNQSRTSSTSQGCQGICTHICLTISMTNLHFPATESTNHNSLLHSPTFNPLFCISCHILTKGARYVLPRLHWSLKSNTMLLLIPLLTRAITTNMHDSNQYATTPPN